jgi:hypothetical protein
MAIPFLNNITLNNNEIQNVRLQNAGSPPLSSGSGQIYFNTGDTLAKYYSNVTDEFVSLKEYSFPTGTYVTRAITGTTPKPIITFDLNAVDGAAVAGERYLTKSNTWAEVSGISGTTYDLGSIQVGSDVAITLVGSNATVDAVTLVAGTNITLTDDGSANITIDASNPDQTVTLTGEVTGTGTTSIATTISDGVLDVANFNASAIVTAAEGIENNDNDTTLPTSASVKAYVDASVVGGLIYQGGYNAATNTPNLDTTPIAGIKKGWTYTVTADGLFFTEQVRVGDVLIAEIDSPTTLADWTTVQNNIDIASASQIGIGNVAAGTGISVSYNDGTATVTNTDLGSSQNIFKNVAVSGQSTVVADGNNDTLTLAAGSNISITTNAATDTVTIANTYVAPTISYAVTISDTATITHGLATKDVIIQLYDVITNETVYADVLRVNTVPYNTATITFAATPTNSVRVLVQKIG